MVPGLGQVEVPWFTKVLYCTHTGQHTSVPESQRQQQQELCSRQHANRAQGHELS